ncbi:hypothetical protein B0T17DRAFT_502856 [Bombardia bombarda]|uniref:Uncharacterized protein n=1 Tax=Bombardia bombarda TaxID=252184 RepID=A0AA39XJZ0_9PEZI|nr:hypothetical protein B0T17DRAFT_502856 [Bombardia bombarda]
MSQTTDVEESGAAKKRQLVVTIEEAVRIAAWARTIYMGPSRRFGEMHRRQCMHPRADLCMLRPTCGSTSMSYLCHPSVQILGRISGLHTGERSLKNELPTLAVVARPCGDELRRQASPVLSGALVKLFIFMVFRESKSVEAESEKRALGPGLRQNADASVALNLAFCCGLKVMDFN